MVLNMLIKSRPKLLSYNGIVDELTCVNTEKKKIVAKRKICRLLEVARAFVFR